METKEKYYLCEQLSDELEQTFSQTRISCRFIGGFQDTRTNKEDFALTPYLFWITM